MTRRELLRTAARGVVAAGLVPRRSVAQSAQRPDSSDRLYDPSMVQSRAVATAADNDAEIKTLEHRLKCTCGCNLDIYTCRTTDFTCSYSPALHREVLELRQEGKSPEQIVAAFVTKYGEQILMAPKPEGFNLAGYLIPGIAVLVVGGALAAVLLRRQRLAPAAEQEPLQQPVAEPDVEQSERLRQALAEVED